MALELDADVRVREDGATEYRFDAIRRQLAAGEVARGSLRLDRRTVDRTVFSTSDTPHEASERDGALFDRALEGPSVDLEGYLPAVDRVGYEHEYELVAFDEELASPGRRRHR